MKFKLTEDKESIGNNMGVDDFLEDMDNFYMGENSTFKYPQPYEVDYDTALDLTGYSGNCTYEGSPMYYDSSIGGMGGWQPPEGAEFDTPQYDYEIEDAYAEDMAKQFAKLNNIDLQTVLKSKYLLKAFIEYNEDSIISVDSVEQIAYDNWGQY